MILLVKVTGRLSAVDTRSKSRLNITIKCVVHGWTEYLYVNRVFQGSMWVERRERDYKTGRRGDCSWMTDTTEGESLRLVLGIVLV